VKQMDSRENNTKSGVPDRYLLYVQDFREQIK
jgi:hypothetical protein